MALAPGADAWFFTALTGMNFLRVVMRHGAMLSTVHRGYFLMVSVLTGCMAVSIIRNSSFAPLFGPSLRRALTFLGPVARKRMPRKEFDVLLPVNRANRYANFVYTASRQGECYGK